MNNSTELARESALVGPAVFSMPGMRRSSGRRTARTSSTPPESASEPILSADIARVWNGVRSHLLAKTAIGRIDEALAAILRDAEFATAWRNASILSRVTTPIETALNPVIPEGLRAIIGGFFDEVQGVANAWAEVLRPLYERPHEPRAEVKAIDERLSHPRYLDDEGLPIEVWETLRARDCAAMSYLALALGMNDGSDRSMLAEYAERHCRYQKQWLDFLSWAFGIKCPSIVTTHENWEHVFDASQKIERGVDALFAHAVNHLDGFAVGEISPASKGGG
jgi:hypothetical protein